MLGYTLNDFRDMQYAIEEGVFYLPPANHDTSRLNLQKVWDMIEGIIQEGAIRRTIREVVLPLSNLQNKLLAELKVEEINLANADGADANFHYIDGRADGIRRVLYLIEQEIER